MKQTDVLRIAEHTDDATTTAVGDDPAVARQLDRIATVLEQILQPIQRIANKLDPPTGDKVGTPYVASRLGCTNVWIAEKVRLGQVPENCIVPGTGNGKPWKFFKTQIDKWLETR